MAHIESHTVPVAPVDPYPGLRPFEAHEDAIFRGRQSHTDELLLRLSTHRFLAIVGTSGSGKSSLVRAGLLPALDRGYLAGATSRWRVAVMRPGVAPIRSLAAALRRPDVLGPFEETRLDSTTIGLVNVVREAKLPVGESLLIVADQFEEVFRNQNGPQSGWRRRCRAVCASVIEGKPPPDVPIYVVLTMRSDFLGDCSQFAGLPEALSDSQYLIPRLTREQRRQAIEDPLRLFGASMTPQLVEQLLNDSSAGDLNPDAVDSLGTVPDPLPVMQHALTRTYDYWKSLPPEEMGHQIDLPHYRAIGRMEAALDQHAEQVFNETIPDDGSRRLIERILRCLTTTELGRPIRRPTPLADLYGIVGVAGNDHAKVDSVLAVLRRRNNLFVTVNRDDVVDISHESLIWKWKRLAGWIREEAASAELYGDLVRDSKEQAVWSEAKVSSAVAALRTDQWNGEWAKQYASADFDSVLGVPGAR